MKFKMFNVYFFAFLIIIYPIFSASDFASHSYPNFAPKAIGIIEDQMIFINGTECGNNDLLLAIAPFFETYGKPVTYCLSQLLIDGDISQHATF